MPAIRLEWTSRPVGMTRPQPGTGIATPRPTQPKRNSVRTRSLLAVLVSVTTSCSAETRRSSSDTASSRPDSPATEGTASPEAPSRSASDTNARWIVTPDGIGAVRVGMTVDELRRAVGDIPGANPTADCSYVRPTSAPPGVSVMLARGHVARVDVDSAGVRTETGVAVGDSAAKIAAAYSARMTATPHKYVPGGQYLTVRSTSPADSLQRMVFETENGRVTRFRTGRLPEVEWIERCG